MYLLSSVDVLTSSVSSCCVVAMLQLLAALSLPLLVLSAPGTVQGPTKGAPWTEEEALIVKAKLYAIIGEYGSRVRQTLRVVGTKTDYYYLRTSNKHSVLTGNWCVLATVLSTSPSTPSLGSTPGPSPSLCPTLPSSSDWVSTDVSSTGFYRNITKLV